MDRRTRRIGVVTMLLALAFVALLAAFPRADDDDVSAECRIAREEARSYPSRYVPRAVLDEMRQACGS